jgi:predicted metal-dependent phosphoesterase TrpH
VSGAGTSGGARHAGSGEPTGRTCGFADLHTHSTASDGSCAPAAVAEAAARAALAVLALTDHDTVAGVPEARAAGNRLGVRVVAGVELSAVHADREIHILGLHLERLDLMEAELEVFRSARRARAEEIVRKLHSLNVPVSLDAVFAEAGDGAIGRPHIARAIIAGGWARDARDAFDRFLGSGRPAFVEKRRLTAGDAIDLIHAAGGLACFAHPSAEGTRSRVEALAALGLDGLEVRHPSHSAEDVARVAALAAHFDLVRTGGSDWHGAGEGPRLLGAMEVPGAWVDEQDARVRRRRSAIPIS